MIQTEVLKERIEIQQGDITNQQVDAIVNAANESLLPGGGVSGAIHRAAGLGLQQECMELGWCNPGEAKITKGYLLPAKWVIHTVGPVWEGGGYDEDKILAQCYRSCLNFVESHQMKTIAFPAISIGAYEFPVERATEIAVTQAREFLEQNTSLEKLIFVCFEPQVYEVYLSILNRI